MTPNLDVAEQEFFHGSPANALPLLRAAAETEPRARWLVGAALGALGRYGEARAQLTAVIEDDPRPCSALAASTLASHYRQLGRHLDARVWDDRAHALAGDDVEACFDARLGLAADAVGIGDLHAARAGLAAARAGGHSAAAGPPELIDTWRQQVRTGWVETEVALLSGNPDTAIRVATAGLVVAEAARAPRHVAKCLLFLGASQHVAGEREPAQTATPERPATAAAGEPAQAPTETLGRAAAAGAGEPAQAPTETLGRAAAAADAVGAVPLRWVCAALLAERADRSGESDLALIWRRIAAAAIHEIGAGLSLLDRKSWLDRVDIAGIVALSR